MAGLSLAAGLVVITIAQILAPLRSPPLYDGVVVQDAYRYLSPGTNQTGSPSSAAATVKVDGPTSPRFAIATTESPPQAQLIAPPGAFAIPAGATSLNAVIEPVADPATPSGGTIAGNVYRFSVVDQAGGAVAVNPETLPTMVLRAPQGIFTATIAHLAGSTWQQLPTLPAGSPGIFVANVSGLGDFTLIEDASPGPLGLDPAILIGIVAIGLLAVVVVVVWLVRSGSRQAVPASSRQRPPPPSKRKRRDRRRGGPPGTSDPTQ